MSRRALPSKARAASGGRLRAAGILALAAALPLAAAHACARHADVRDSVAQGTSFTPEPGDDAGVPPLDADLGNDAYPTCGDRPLGDCIGVDDFPCDFAVWAVTVAADCQTATGCKTNGTVEITMGPEGCVTSIGMDEPNPEIVECLTAELGAWRCPCTEEEKVSHFFGLGNDGTCPE